MEMIDLIKELRKGAEAKSALLQATEALGVVVFFLADQPLMEISMARFLCGARFENGSVKLKAAPFLVALHTELMGLLCEE